MKKRIAIVSATVLAVIALGVLGVEAWLRHTVRDAVERAVGGGGADVHIGRVSVSLPLRQVSLRDVRVHGQGGEAVRQGHGLVSFDVSLSRLTLRGVGRTGADAMSVTGAALELVLWSESGSHSRLAIGGVGLSALGVTLDSLPASLSLRADSLLYTPGGGATVLRADTLSLTAPSGTGPGTGTGPGSETRTGTITLAGLSLTPSFDKALFADRSPGHTDWTSIRLGAIDCRGVDIARLLSARPEVAIDSIRLASADIASYKNRKVFTPSSVKPLLHESIHRLPLPVAIGALSFDDLDITYEELAEHGDTPGRVTLTSGHGRAFNITNAPTTPHTPHTTIDIAATLMHSGALEARMVLPVDPRDAAWQLTGRLGPTDMTAFNPALEPLMNARLASGAIRSLSFEIAADSVRSHTRLVMAYDDLSVEFLDRHDPTRVRRFLTAVADDMLIRPSNPARDGRGPLRTAGSDATRDPERSVWNYIWRSLEGAILKTVI